jgi:hypothetical protein
MTSFRLVAGTLVLGVSMIACETTVTEVTVFGPACSPTIGVGDSVGLNAVAMGTGALFGYLYSSSDAPQRFRWRSSDTSIATIDAAGFLRTKAPGVAAISSETAGIWGTLTIDVQPSDLIVVMEPTFVRLVPGERTQLTASVTDRIGAPVITPRPALWWVNTARTVSVESPWNGGTSVHEGWLIANSVGKQRVNWCLGSRAGVIQAEVVSK